MPPHYQETLRAGSLNYLYGIPRWLGLQMLFFYAFTTFTIRSSTYGRASSKSHKLPRPCLHFSKEDFSGSNVSSALAISLEHCSTFARLTGKDRCFVFSWPSSSAGLHGFLKCDTRERSSRSSPQRSCGFFMHSLAFIVLL